MTEELREILEEAEAIVYPDLEPAIVGYTLPPNVRAVYDFYLCIFIRMGEGATYEDALDDLGYNTLGQYVGDKTPLFVVLTENNREKQAWLNSRKDKAETPQDGQGG